MLLRTSTRYTSSLSLASVLKGNFLHSYLSQHNHSSRSIILRNINTNHSPLNEKIIIGKQSLKTKSQIDEFLGQLSTEQKSILFNQLNLNILAHKYQHGESGYEIHQYLSKFGRPSTYVEGINDSVGQRENLVKSMAEHQLSSSTSTAEDTNQLNEEIQQIPPSSRDIYAVGLKNALPFVGFGFLDNLIMIVAGDYIDSTIGTVLGISTMAAAALGNTISDVAGIASAWYVEHFSEKFGIHTPKLTTFQANSWQVRWAINAGRAIGVTIGCLLGMIPLIFLPMAAKSEEKRSAKAQSKTKE